MGGLSNYVKLSKKLLSSSSSSLKQTIGVCNHNRIVASSSSASSNCLLRLISSSSGNCSGSGSICAISTRSMKNTMNINLISFRSFATATDSTQKKTPSSSSFSSPSNIFLDNLGKIFLSAIGLIIAALTRSSMATSNKTKLRTSIEERSILDPFEVDDLRLANCDLDEKVFTLIMDRLMMGQEMEKWIGTNQTGHNKMDYREFISAVMNIMKEVKGEGFTVQLGHLLDRVILSILDKVPSTSEKQYVDEHGRIELSLLLVALSLCINENKNVRNRVETLFEIMKRKQNTNAANHTTNNNTATPIITTTTVVDKKYIIEMIHHLQNTCQLAPDAQIVESETKYPIQQYRIGTPQELVELGIQMKKDELNEEALIMSKNNDDGSDGDLTSKWTCDDFHHLLRSRAVCAWGECYVKKKGLKD